MEENVKHIDMTPTWEGILPFLLTVISSGGMQAQHAAKQELRRMAQIADMYVASQKNNPTTEE